MKRGFRVNSYTAKETEDREKCTSARIQLCWSHSDLILLDSETGELKVLQVGYRKTNNSKSDRESVSFTQTEGRRINFAKLAASKW